MREVVFTRLHLPRPLEAEAVTELLTRLMGSDVPRPAVFELHADKDGIAYLLGCAPTAVQRLKRLLRGHVPGVAFALLGSVASMTYRPGVTAKRADGADGPAGNSTSR